MGLLKTQKTEKERRKAEKEREEELFMQEAREMLKIKAFADWIIRTHPNTFKEWMNDSDRAILARAKENQDKEENNVSSQSTESNPER